MSNESAEIQEAANEKRGSDIETQEGAKEKEESGGVEATDSSDENPAIPPVPDASTRDDDSIQPSGPDGFTRWTTIVGLMLTAIGVAATVLGLYFGLHDDDSSETPSSTSPTQTPSPSPTQISAWQQISSTISGTSSGQGFGLRVGLNYNGTTMAVLSEADIGGRFVEVFDLVDGADPSWVPRGNKMFVSVPGVHDTVDTYVELSDDANTVAFFDRHNGNGIGVVQRFENEAWVPLWVRSWQNISTKWSFRDLGIDSISGFSGLRMSPDGSHVVAAIQGKNATEVNIGLVQAYSMLNGQFHGRTLFTGSGSVSSLGSSISRLGLEMVVHGLAAPVAYRFGGRDWGLPSAPLTRDSACDGGLYSLYGYPVAISGDGRTVAVGDWRAHADAGCVSVFQFDQTGAWSHIGQGIVGDRGSDKIMGRSFIDLSRNGKVLLVSLDPQSIKGATTAYGSYRLENDMWQRLNNVEVQGDVKLDCSLSGNGETLVCVTPGHLVHNQLVH